MDKASLSNGIREENQEANENFALNEIIKMNEKLELLEARIETLERMADKVPEFRDYWKKLNACGYMD